MSSSPLTTRVLVADPVGAANPGLVVAGVTAYAQGHMP